MQKFHNNPLDFGVEVPIIGKNSEAFSEADPVSIDSNGFLIVSVAGGTVFGYSLETVTMSGTNQTVAKVCPKVCPALSGVKMKYTADQACTQTDIGAYADLVGTTGAIQMNLAAGSAGQFLVVQMDSENDGTTTEVVVEVAEPQQLAYAQV